jgi:hypothetical protein
MKDKEQIDSLNGNLAIVSRVPRRQNGGAPSMENALKNLLRIHDHVWSRKHLNRKRNGDHFNLCSWMCYCEAASEHFEQFMGYLRDKGGLHIDEWTIEPSPSVNSDENQQEESESNPSLLENSSIPMSENSFERFLSMVEYLMRWQEIRYAPETKNVYIRIENASCSYQFYLSLSDLLSHWTSKEYASLLEDSRMLSSDRAKQWKMLVIQYGERFLKIVEKFGGKFLPLYKPNYDYVEFMDTFYEISSGKCLQELESPDVICFRYFPLSIQQAMQTAPRRWLTILQNSLVNEQMRRFCYEYARLFRGERERREKCLYLLGESQCGKSSLLAPLEALYGLENVGVMSQAKQSSLEDLVGKRIGILDEFSSKLLSRESFLMLAEGQPMKISVKYRRNPRIERPQHLIFSSNNLPHYIKQDESGAVQSRISIYRFYKLRGRIEHDALIQIRDKETPYVLLYCNRVYLQMMHAMQAKKGQNPPTNPRTLMMQSFGSNVNYEEIEEKESECESE